MHAVCARQHCLAGLMLIWNRFVCACVWGLWFWGGGEGRANCRLMLAAQAAALLAAASMG